MLDSTLINPSITSDLKQLLNKKRRAFKKGEFLKSIQNSSKVKIRKKQEDIVEEAEKQI